MTYRYREMRKTYRRCVLRHIKAFKHNPHEADFFLLVEELSEYMGYALANDDYSTYNAVARLRCNIVREYYRHTVDVHIYA